MVLRHKQYASLVEGQYSGGEQRR